MYSSHFIDEAISPVSGSYFMRCPKGKISEYGEGDLEDKRDAQVPNDPAVNHKAFGSIMHEPMLLLCQMLEEKNVQLLTLTSCGF